MLRVALVGVGLVGSEFLEQLRQNKARLIGEEGLVLRVKAVCSSKKMLLASGGEEIELGDWRRRLEESREVADVELLVRSLLTQSEKENVPCVLVDCTSSEQIASQYVSWMQQGIHIATPNKKAFSSENETIFHTLNRLRNEKRVYCFHETTVGAGLPIISTLKELIATGDQIHAIEGVFSGTLSYLFNCFSPSDSEKEPPLFSSIVTEAKNKGYTEPDPRDDLSGMDVARKVVILARLCNWAASLPTTPVHNLIPEQLRSCSAAEFMQQLPNYDSYFAQINRDAIASNSVLRYVGVVTPTGCSVELRKYAKSHAFAHLNGSDNIISFQTQRYSPSPLIIRGPGAGASVTAAGLFGDVLKLAALLAWSLPRPI